MTFNTYPIKLKNGSTYTTPLIPTYYVLLRIENIGKTSLRDTQVVLRRILEGKSKNPFFPLNLQWSFKGESESISPYGGSKAVALFEIANPVEASSVLAKLDEAGGVIDRERYVQQIEGFRASSIHPNTLSDIFPAGEYLFQILISAENAESKTVKIFISYDNGWTKDTTIEEMRTKYLKVKLLS